MARSRAKEAYTNRNERAKKIDKIGKERRSKDIREKMRDAVFRLSEKPNDTRNCSGHRKNKGKNPGKRLGAQTVGEPTLPDSVRDQKEKDLTGRITGT